jgi:hypothetical protein
LQEGNVFCQKSDNLKIRVGMIVAFSDITAQRHSDFRGVPGPGNERFLSSKFPAVQACFSDEAGMNGFFAPDF